MAEQDILLATTCRLTARNNRYLERSFVDVCSFVAFRWSHANRLRSRTASAILEASTETASFCDWRDAHRDPTAVGQTNLLRRTLVDELAHFL